MTYPAWYTKRMIIAASIYDSPVGPLLLRARDGRLVGLSFHVDSREPRANGEARDARLLDSIRSQLREYFDGQRTQFDIPLALEGSEFHRRVWQALLDIPYGQAISYGQLAERVGVSGEARAVGAANGANPIAIIVPCHRVIGADGKLVGYGGGLWRKQKLLDLESKRLSLAL